MLKPFAVPRKKTTPSLAHRVLDVVLRFFAIYIVPIGIAVMSLIALVSWQEHYVSGGNEELGMQVLAANVPLSPAQALLQLSLRPPLEAYDTQLSEAPIWFTF